MAEEVFSISGVDALYTIDPAEFVKARNDLVARVKSEGRPASAAQVARVKRPTRAAFAINQIARTNQGKVAALLEAGAAVREAQTAVVSGGDRTVLREAISERRRIIADLASLAPAHRDVAAATFEAASVDNYLAGLLLRGRFTAEVEPRSGFDFGSMEPADAELHALVSNSQTVTQDKERLGEG
jgi:hypothetical protein